MSKIANEESVERRKDSDPRQTLVIFTATASMSIIQWQIRNKNRV